MNLSTESTQLKVPSVIPDNGAAGTLAARHLVELGLKHFAFWGDPLRRYSIERETSFAKELNKHGFEHTSLGFEVSRLPWARKWQRVRKEMLVQLKRLPDHPIGIFAKDDIAATGISNACASLGLAVPEKLPFSDATTTRSFCYMASPPLSSIDYPAHEIGKRAAKLLRAQLWAAPADQLYVPCSPPA